MSPPPSLTFPPELLQQYVTITDKESSKSVLGDFSASKPSFFTLVAPLLQKLGPTDVTQDSSFFIGEPTGALPSLKPIEHHVSSRLIWAAAKTLQNRLAPFLLTYFSGMFSLRESGEELEKAFVHSEIFMVRFCIKHFLVEF
jgi:hypothetical protein